MEEVNKCVEGSDDGSKLTGCDGDEAAKDAVEAAEDKIDETVEDMATKDDESFEEPELIAESDIAAAEKELTEDVSEVEVKEEESMAVEESVEDGEHRMETEENDDHGNTSRSDLKEAKTVTSPDANKENVSEEDSSEVEDQEKDKILTPPLPLRSRAKPLISVNERSKRSVSTSRGAMMLSLANR